MLDIKYIRSNLDQIKAGAAVKRIFVDWDRFLVVDKKRGEMIEKIEQKRKINNDGAAKVARLSDPKEKQVAILEMKTLNGELKQLEEDLQKVEREFNELMLSIPNPPHEDSPIGKDDQDNIAISHWGEVPQFSFNPLSHIELGEKLGLLDIASGVKVAGSRNYFLRGEGVLLEMAILHYTLDFLAKRKYVPYSCPMLVKEDAMVGTGYFPGGKDQAYFIEKDKLALIGTSEVPLVSLHGGEILTQKSLPRRYAGISSCFRREAGTYGKDTKGLYRVHQFQKVEQVVICINSQDESERMHEELLNNSEQIMQSLELPYRVVNVCTGDLGMGQIKKHDIEAWMPSREGYCETHSCSTFYEFQARRLKIRYKDDLGKNVIAHTLNNTAIASPRILIPLLEVHQQADGTVKIPDVLVPYMQGKQFIGK